ncbi:MAG: hypothetical protein U9P50_01770 [Patescibacteria group bacterium]|nr:hypothetical protein [Patescibacteria group bacterium]
MKVEIKNNQTGETKWIDASEIAQYAPQLMPQVGSGIPQSTTSSTAGYEKKVPGQYTGAGETLQNLMASSGLLPMAGGVLGKYLGRGTAKGTGIGTAGGQYLKGRLQAATKAPMGQWKGVSELIPPPERRVEELGTAGATGLAAGLSDFVLSKLFGVGKKAIGKVGEKVKSILGSGKTIETTAETTAAEYPAKLILQELKEKGTTIKSQSGKDALKQIYKTIKQNTTKQGMVGGKDLQWLKVGFRDEASETAKAGAKRAFNMAQNVVKNVIVGPEGIMPELRVPYGEYGLLGKAKGVGRGIKRTAEWTIPKYYMYKILRGLGL